MTRLGALRLFEHSAVEALNAIDCPTFRFLDSQAPPSEIQNLEPAPAIMAPTAGSLIVEFVVRSLLFVVNAHGKVLPCYVT